MIRRLSLIDFLVIGAYLLVMAYIAWRSRRFSSKGLENYFLGGRIMPGWLAGLSYAASMMSADSAVAYGGMAVITGLFVCWFYLARFGLAFFIGAVLFAIFWRRLNTFTALEFYELRFAGRPATLIRLWLALRTSLIAMVAWTAISLLALAKITSPILGIDKTEIFLVAVPITVAYIYFSGYAGLVVSNLIQVAAIGVGSLVLAMKVLWSVGGPHALGLRLEHAFGPSALSNFPPAGNEVFPLAAAVAWLLGTSLGYGGDAAPMSGAVEGQRILSTRSPRAACEMYLTTEVATFSMVWLVSIPCLAAGVLWPELRTGRMDRELAYGMLMARFLGPGLLGLVLVAMLAGIMAVVGDNLNFGSQILMSDVYRRFLVRGASEKHYFVVGRICIFIILGLALLVAYRVHYLFDIAIFMVGFATAELPANWAQWWWWRFNGWGRLAGSFGGGMLFLGLVVFFPQMKWWTRMYITLIISTLLWVGVTLFTPSEPRDLLNSFYERARPLGWWGPIQTSVRGAASRSDWESGKTILKGLGIAALGAVSVMCYIVGISDLYLGRWHAGILLLVVMLGSGMAFWRLFSSYVTGLMNAEERRIVTSSEEGTAAEILGLNGALLFAALMVALVSLTYAAFFSSGTDRWIGLLVSIATGGISWKLGRRRHGVTNEEHGRS